MVSEEAINNGDIIVKGDVMPGNSRNISEEFDQYEVTPQEG
jgi:hypothetical protein